MTAAEWLWQTSVQAVGTLAGIFGFWGAAELIERARRWWSK